VLSSWSCFALLVTSYVFLVSRSDIFNIFSWNISMPGSAVAVERVFSGGQDTISLRHASLHADTIWILMLVKKQLHLAHAKANTALHCWILSIQYEM
jgi:hypothetical protein